METPPVSFFSEALLCGVAKLNPTLILQVDTMRMKCSPLLDDICYSTFFSEKNIAIKITENTVLRHYLPQHTNTKPSPAGSSGGFTHTPPRPASVKSSSTWPPSSFAPGYRVLRLFLCVSTWLRPFGLRTSLIPAKPAGPPGLWHPLGFLKTGHK